MNTVGCSSEPAPTSPIKKPTRFLPKIIKAVVSCYCKLINFLMQHSLNRFKSKPELIRLIQVKKEPDVFN
jgi:hypothetical protein